MPQSQILWSELESKLNQSHVMEAKMWVNISKWSRRNHSEWLSRNKEHSIIINWVPVIIYQWNLHNYVIFHQRHSWHSGWKEQWKLSQVAGLFNHPMTHKIRYFGHNSIPGRAQWQVRVRYGFTFYRPNSTYSMTCNVHIPNLFCW